LPERNLLVLGIMSQLPVSYFFHYERLVFRMMDSLRGVLPLPESLLFALQLLAWVRLSRQAQLPVAWQCTPESEPIDVAELAAVFQQLREHLMPVENRPAFDFLQEPSKYVNSQQLQRLFGELREADVTAPWPAVALADYTATFQSQPVDAVLMGLPPAVADLLLNLLPLTADTRLYGPFDASLQLTCRALAQTAHTYTSTPYHTPLPALLSILSGERVQVAVGDELTQPVFQEAGQLQQFEAGVAMPPPGARVSEEIKQRDRFGRFQETTSSLAVLSIRHLLATVRGPIAVGVPNGLLFSSGVEHALRVELLRRGIVSGVIALPPALLPESSQQFSVLVLDPSQHISHVQFVDGNRPEFYTRTGRGRSQLTNWPVLSAALRDRQDGPFARLVPVAEILANDANLQASRYCDQPALAAARSLKAAYDTRPLGELVQVVRPLPPVRGEDSVKVAEINPGDFPAYGYLPAAGRHVAVSARQLARDPDRGVRAHDVILTVKGPVGRVTLIGTNPAEATIVGQSCLGLRLPAESPLDARVLWLFLRSAPGQALLQRIVSVGSTVPLIQLRELLRLPVPVPVAAEQQVLLERFSHLQTLEEHRQLLRQEQANLLENAWLT
jgi:type I restriction enzyme M protein